MLYRLFTIKLHHHFYNDLSWQDARLQADDKTASFLLRYELLTKQSKEGLSVYYFGVRDAHLFVSSLPLLLENSPFTLNMICTNPYWLNMSALPMNWAGQLDVTVPSSTRETSRTMRMTLADRKVSENGVIGQVRIYPNDLFDQNGRPSQPEFRIDMSARKTQWRYYVSTRSIKNSKNLSIKNRKGIRFDAPVEVTLTNGEASQMFSSGKQMFAIKQSIKNPFDLYDESSAQGSEYMLTNIMSKPIIRALPTPRIDTLGIDTDKGAGVVYSPMYVQV